MKRFVSALAVVCLLALSPATLAAPRDDDPRRAPGPIGQIVEVVKHLITALGDSLSPPKP